MKQFVMMLFGYTELRLSQSLATARFLHFKKINSQDFNKALRSLVPSPFKIIADDQTFEI